MKPIRLIAVVAMFVVALQTGSSAVAQPAEPTCFLSATTLSPGQSFVVSGNALAAGDTIRVILDSGAGQAQIGIGSATGTPPSFSITATLPANTSAPATHTVSVVEVDGGGGTTGAFCGTIFVQQAATPTPTTTPVPTVAPVVTPSVVFIPLTGPIVAQQQQQQQQQGGGGGGQQQQPGQQHQPVPVPVAPRFIPTGGVSLPKTGADVARTAAIGSALVLFGLVLVLFARRRRRIARTRALAVLPPIDAVVVEPEVPWVPGTAHPSEFLTEADGLPPQYRFEPQLLLPAPAEDDDDVLTPSF